MAVDGSCYDGYWLNDAKNGHGRLAHVGGDVYEGEFVSGRQRAKASSSTMMALRMWATGERIGRMVLGERNGQMDRPIRVNI